MQPLDTFDRNAVGAGATNARAHRVQCRCEIDNFRLTRSVLEDCFTLRQRGCHHQVFSSGHSHHVGHDACTSQSLRFGDDVPLLDTDRRAKRFEPLDVLIDRARTDRATTRQRHACAARARDQRAEHQNGRTHRLHKLVGRFDTREITRLSRTVAPSRSAATPICFSSFSVVATSCSCGTLSTINSSAVNSDAARIGSAAFLAPETVISPARRRHRHEFSVCPSRQQGRPTQ